MTEELSPFYIGCSLPRKLDELRKVRQRMEEWPVPYSFAEQVEEKTGMLFWSWNGQGRKRMEEKEKEMQAAGLFKR
ncbi:hypothetical protein D7V81_11165 [bacterium 1XD21-70]|nr:hypothetical protein D7V81_11165 [bacterium 1XD21-70]